MAASPSAPSSSKTTFPLYGYERFFAMAPNASARLAFVLTLRGDVATLLANLPLAVMHTFNQHPKMRACLLPGVVPQTAMVCAPLVDVSELHEKLFSVEWRANYDANATEWMQFVQKECETPVDREQQWPFAVRVFADKTSQRFARIVLLADHYMADASTGAIVLNTILQHAATVSASGGGSSGSTTIEALPLVPSLYECMHSRSAISSWMGVFHEAVAKWVLEPLFHFDHAVFTPVLAVDKASQQDFRGQPPSPANPSQALFAQGTAANMQRALAKCEEEGVSLQGAMTAATMLAFGLAQRHGDLRATVSDTDTAASSSTEPGKITMKTDVSLDLRDRYAARLGGDSHAVGLYSTSGNLVFTGSEGASIHESFWDLARKSDREWRETRDGHELTLQSLYVHETLTAESLTEQSGSLEVQNCVLSDATLSTTTLYTYPHEVTLHKADEGSPPTTTSLHVETYHVYNSLPSLSSACVVFLSGVSSFNYSLMAKLEHGLAQELFHWFTETMEHVGEIHECDSLLQVSDKLTRFAAVAPAPGQAASCSV